MINGSGLQPTFLGAMLGTIAGGLVSRKLFGRRGGGGGNQPPPPPKPFWMENPQVLMALAKAIEEFDRSRADYGKRFLSSLNTASDYDKQLGQQVNFLLGKAGGGKR